LTRKQQKVVETEAGAPREAVARPFVNRGRTRWQQGDTVGALADYTAVVEFEDAPRELVKQALLNRGFGRGQQGMR
jgi:hypothetical protein